MKLQSINQCPVLPGGYHLVTVGELNALAHMFTYIDNGVLKGCPALVWSRDEKGNPIMVRIVSCNGEGLEIIRNPNLLKCKAQRICVANSFKE